MECFIPCETLSLPPEMQPESSHIPQVRVPTGQDKTTHYSPSLSQSTEGIYAQEHSGDARFADLP